MKLVVTLGKATIRKVPSSPRDGAALGACVVFCDAATPQRAEPVEGSAVHGPCSPAVRT